MQTATDAVLPTGCPGAGEQNTVGEGARADGQVRPPHGGAQISAGGREPAAAADVAVERPEALLPETVDVIGARVAGLFRGGEEGLEQGVVGGTAFQPERAPMPA